MGAFSAQNRARALKGEKNMTLMEALILRAKGIALRDDEKISDVEDMAKVAMKNRIVWIVLNDDLTYAGRPCYSWEEAKELLAQDPNRTAYILELNESDVTHSVNGYI